jgi:hypothetical protein
MVSEKIGGNLITLPLKNKFERWPIDGISGLHWWITRIEHVVASNGYYFVKQWWVTIIIAICHKIKNNVNIFVTQDVIVSTLDQPLLKK